jgi:hypothetical protein
MLCITANGGDTLNSVTDALRSCGLIRERDEECPTLRETQTREGPLPKL